jgi:hypothetical protein
MRFRSMSSNLAGRTIRSAAFRQCEVSPAVRTWQDNTLGLHGTSPLALELQLAKATQCRRLTLLKAEVATPVCTPQTTSIPPYCLAYQIWTSWGPWQDVIHDALPHVPTEYSAFGLQFPWFMSDSSVELALAASISISFVASHVVIIVRSGTGGLRAHRHVHMPHGRYMATELVRQSVTTLGQFGASYRDQSGCHKISRGSFLASLSTVSR